MTRRARTALGSVALLGLAAGALLWAWLGVDRPLEREQAAKEREARVFSFDGGDVREVTVTAKGDVTRLVREPGPGAAWRIAAPVAAPADPYAPGALVDALAGLKRTREVAPPPGGDLAAHGLVAPKVRVEAVLADGRRESLAIGDESAFDGAVFARPTSGAVVALPPGSRWAFDKGTLDLRDRRLLPFDRERVAAVRVTSGRATYELRRKGDEWTVDGSPADATRVSALLGALEALRALRFEDAAAPGSHGLAAPARSVVLLDEAGKELARVDAGEVKGDDAFVRAGNGPVAVVSRGALDAVPATPATLLAPAPRPSPSPSAPAAAEVEKRVDPGTRSP